MLKGKQKKLDVNKDGKISGEDFAMLKNVRMQKKDAMGKKVVKAQTGKMLTETEAPDLGGMMGAEAASEAADRISEVDTAMAERVARRRPLSMLGEEKEKPMTPKERREKDIAKRAQKKKANLIKDPNALGGLRIEERMGGGMMQDSMGYKKGGSVIARGNKLARSKPTKMF